MLYHRQILNHFVCPTFSLVKWNQVMLGSCFCFLSRRKKFKKVFRCQLEAKFKKDLIQFRVLFSGKIILSTKFTQWLSRLSSSTPVTSKERRSDFQVRKTKLTSVSIIFWNFYSGLFILWRPLILFNLCPISNYSNMIQNKLIKLLIDLHKYLFGF